MVAGFSLILIIQILGILMTLLWITFFVHTYFKSQKPDSSSAAAVTLFIILLICNFISPKAAFATFVSSIIILAAITVFYFISIILEHFRKKFQK